MLRTNFPLVLLDNLKQHLLSMGLEKFITTQVLNTIFITYLVCIESLTAALTS